MKINTNIVSMQTQNNLRKNSMNLENAMNRLSSGKRINTAADDAAGLAISSRMQTKMRGMDVGVRNSNDGISLVQTAEAALGSITNILQRMRELAVQSANGTNNTTDRDSLNSEYTQLKTEIDHIATNTTFNGVDLLNAGAAVIKIQLSDVANDSMDINLIDAQTSGMNLAAAGGAAGLSADITSAANASNALLQLDEAVTEISDKRAGFGASLNRLQFNIDNMSSMSTNLASAKSRVEDADMAKEVSEMTKNKVLVQSGMAMLSQANQNPQMITQLLQGN
ncbi:MULTISPECIES: flagellin N-terminal helical domain-containing protein [Bacillus cereus group]|uniref:Flagellin n=2 Tax=Bacillus cereus group TaxID=86661 RepID=A0A9X6WII3_BACTU|nr:MULTISPECIES: flagellin [Bacillus cereus group]MDA1674549.1 flagellin [Bacillus cereus group sp. TH152-1LC]PFJ30268.1 flagellin [Bacillus thuringiensis]PGP12489.1 flagellin [Bacillus cereus]